MTWKYKLRTVVIFDGEYHNDFYQIVEDYGNEGYVELNANDWIFETKTEAIETLKMMLKDITDESNDQKTDERV